MSRFRIWYYGQPRAIRTLLTINVAAYLVWQILLVHFEPTRTFVVRHIALNPSLPGILYEPWQLLTYSFLHLSPGLQGLLHILFNMLWMIWIGREYEQMQGPRKMLALYVTGGIGGGLLTVVLHSVFPEFGPFGGPVVGASGSVLGIMTGIAVEYPQKTIALIFIGVVRLIHVVFGFVFLDILFLSAGGTSVSAHLGGVLSGLLWAKLSLAGIDISGWAAIFYPSRSSGNREGFLHRLEAAFEKRQQAGRSRGGGSQSEKGDPQREVVPDSSKPASKTVREREIDAILDKISAEGYDSLTKQEKILLDEASRDE